MFHRVPVVAALLLILTAASTDAQANGKLQIHFMHVGQGDGAVLISPDGFPMSAGAME